MYNWLVETKFATEVGYPNQINLNAMKILSGDEVYPTETCILRSSIGAAKDIIRKGVPNIKIFFGYEKHFFDANIFMTEFKDFALNKDCCYLTLGQVKKTFKSEDNVFCRPVSGFKIFAGGMLNKDKMYERLVEDKLISNSTLCLVAPGQQLDFEYRMVIAGKEIIGKTGYLPEETPYVPDNVIAFTNEVLEKIASPDDFYCLDIALVCGEPKIIEWNSFTSSGLYCCDIPEMCGKVEAYLQKLEEDML